MERQIERVLILADEPILKRPIPVELVKLALPQACKVDKPLCTKVSRYLERYSRDYALTHASVTGALTHGADGVVPNALRAADAKRLGSLHAGLRAAERLSARERRRDRLFGAHAADRRTLSLGFNWAQLDVGYRAHWWSPATDCSMLMSTEAPTIPVRDSCRIGSR